MGVSDKAEFQCSETLNETSFLPLARPADEIMSLAETSLGCNLLMSRGAGDLCVLFLGQL